jgi:hypothetical protein
LADEKAFDFAPARVTAAKQASREDAGVIDDQQVARTKVSTELAKIRILNASALAPKHKQPRPPPLSRRFLGNQFPRQLEVEIGDIHDIRLKPDSTPTSG